MSEKNQKKCEICRKHLSMKDTREINEICNHEYHSNCFLDYLYNYVKEFELPIKCPNKNCNSIIILPKILANYSSSQLSEMNKIIRVCESCQQYSSKKQMIKLGCGHRICKNCEKNSKECKKCNTPQEIKDEKVKKCYICKAVGVQRKKMKCCRKKICYNCLKSAYNSYKNKKNNIGSRKKFLCPHCNKKNNDEDLAISLFEEQKDENEKKTDLRNEYPKKLFCNLCNINYSFMSFNLLCGHSFCLKCFFKDSSPAFPEQCPLKQCKKEIDECVSSNFFSINENLKKIKNNHKIGVKGIKEEPFVKEFICEVCTNEFKVEDLLTLSCEHRFCKNCLLQDWETKVNEFKISKNFWICLKENCGEQIDYEIIRANMPPKLFLKYDELLLNHTVKNIENFTDLKENEKQVTCPECSIDYIVGKDFYYFKCEKCGEVYCAKETCYRKWSEHKKDFCDFPDRKKEEKEFENYVKENKLKECPVCKSMIEKTRNCNYICCGSIVCQKKTYFCYLCGNKLNKEELKTHYLNNSNYSKCKNI